MFEKDKQFAEGYTVDKCQSLDYTVKLTAESMSLIVDNLDTSS